MIANRRQNYLVQTPVSNGEETYSIEKMLYIDTNDAIAAYWAVVRVSYWIYNLIRAVFVQNLNVYLRKTCTGVLFKVLPI